MKQEFDKAKPIEFTAPPGSTTAVYQIYRADIQSVQAAPKQALGNTIIHLKICERHPEGGQLSLDDDVEDVVDRLNGMPDDATVRDWEDAILQRRVTTTQSQKAALEAAYPRDQEKQRREYKKVIDGLSERDTEIRSALDRCARQVHASPRLKLALRLQDYAGSLASNTIRAKVISMLAQGMGGEGWDHINYVALNKDAPNSIEKIKVNIKADLDLALAGLKRKFEERLGELEGLLDDPQMTDEDTASLARKIEEHRISHAEPDFTFVHDPASHSYRPKVLVERERRDGRSQRLRGVGPFSATIFGHER